MGTAAPASGGGGSGDAVWGSITGTLSNQTDLATALAGKQDTLTAGTGIDITNDVISATGGGGGSSTALSVENKNTAVGATNPLNFWNGTQAEYEIDGGNITWYNWLASVYGWNDIPDSSDLTGIFGSITYGNNKYIVTDMQYGFLWVSTDGTTWNRLESTGLESFRKNTIRYVNNKFFILGYNLIGTSTDGITWSTETIPSDASDRSLYDITYGNNKYIIVGGSGAILSSSDGSTWTIENSNTNGDIRSVIYANNMFIAVGSVYNDGDYGILTSNDGSTWTFVQISYKYLYSIVYGNNKFITVGYGGRIYSSTDGTNWIRESSGTDRNLQNVIYANNKFYAVGDGDVYGNGYGIIISSIDGSTWTIDYNEYEHSLIAIAYGTKLVAVGSRRIMNYGLSSYPCYTTDEQPTTSSQVYPAPNTQSVARITAVGTDTITLSDNETYTYNASGNQSVITSVGVAHPDWICFIHSGTNSLNIKQGNPYKYG